MTKEIVRPSGCRSRKSGPLHGLFGVRLVHDVGGRPNVIEADFHQEVVKSQAMLLELSEPLGVTQGLQQWVQFPLKRLWQQRPRFLKGCLSKSHGDSNRLERVANVLTSVPFIFAGLGAPRERDVTKLYANSTIGIGLASSLYHCSRGEKRTFFRRIDYMMIATSALCLSRALRSDNHKAMMTASALLVPFEPLLVTALHTGLMEVTFAQRARAEPRLRKVHTWHVASSVVGCGLFLAEEVFPDTPFLHACWHLVAAVGVVTSNKLLK